MTEMREVVEAAFSDLHAFKVQFDTWHGSPYNGDVIHIPSACIGLHVSTIDRSNFRTLNDEHEFLVEDSHGAYISYLAWRVEEDWENETAQVFHERLEIVRDLIGGLVDYPIYDEDDWSKLEMEDQEEAWDMWAAPTCEKCDEKMDMPINVDEYPVNEQDDVYFPDSFLEAAKAQHKCAN